MSGIQRSRVAQNDESKGTRDGAPQMPDDTAGALEWGVGVVAYARSSSDDQERSCPQQIRAIEEEAQKLGVLGAAAERVQAKLAELNRRIEQLEREQARLRAGNLGRSPAAERADEARVFSRVFDEASLAERKSLIAHFVARIDIDADSGVLRVGFRRPPLLAA